MCTSSGWRLRVVQGGLRNVALLTSVWGSGSQRVGDLWLFKLVTQRGPKTCISLVSYGDPRR